MITTLQETLSQQSAHRRFRQAAGQALALLALLLIRLGLQAALYQAGFVALTADEFGRTVMAARFALSPEMEWGGAWLPLHMVLVGGLLRLSWDLLLLPRLVSVFFGAVSVLMMAELAAHLSGSRRVGFIAALLLGLTPGHLWLSSVPLTEIVHFTLVLVFLLAFLRYLKGGDYQLLFLSALVLALANGFRYEAWLVSLPFSAGLVGVEGLRFLQGRSNRQRLFVSLLAGALPWLFPLAWIWAGSLEAGQFFGVLADIKTYKQVWYGSGAGLANDLRPLFELDPFLLAAGLAGAAALVRRSMTGWWYTAFTGIPLILFLYLHGGQAEPEGNPVRYLAPYLFLFCPPAAFALDAALQRSIRAPTGRNLLLGCVVLSLSAVQVGRTLEFTNSTSSRGLAVGQRLRTLRAADPSNVGRGAMIELVYWDYLAIHVGANDLNQIVYDRPLDLERRGGRSILQDDIPGFQDCLAEYQIGYVIVRSPELRRLAEEVVGGAVLDEVSGYAFYAVPNSLIDRTVEPGTCPLGIGRGY